SGCDGVFIAVPSGFREGKIELDAVRSAARDVGSSMKRGALVSLETSVPPGTTRKLLVKELEHSSGMKAGTDFYVAYSPERIFEGRALHDLEENYQKVVSGINEASLEKAAKYYSIIAKKGIIKMSSLEAAETEKLFEGIYRDVNIALSNELAKYCEASGLDYWEVRSAANSQPYSHLHKPGAGVGGACIPVYPWFIIYEADRVRLDLELVRTARKVNDSQPEQVAAAALADTDLQPGDRVAILGLAFRGDVDDDRFSPSYSLVNYFVAKSFAVTVHDPYISKSKPKGFSLTSSIEQALHGAKLVIVATDHSMYRDLSFSDVAGMASPGSKILDARGVLKRPNPMNEKWKVLGVGSRG
ncbi:MAG: nucleotide sugar dehydrogenase, partial [Nitrososphaerota archaeon]|nr:nucleotide sugar dehydrogenase [Nitrososphaerota archaeon]